MEPKGYNIPTGYMGLIDGEYMLFASEADYLEYLAEIKREINT